MNHSHSTFIRSLKALPVLAATLCLLSSPDKALALSTVDDIASGQMVPTVEQPIVGPSKEIPPSHWSYHLVQKLAEQAHLQEKDIPLDGSRPINRTEMAVLLADLSDKTPMLEGQLSEKEQTQFEILREEFQSEVKVLEARITKVENSVQELSARVDDHLLKDAGTAHGPLSPTFQPYGVIEAWGTYSTEEASATDHNIRMRRTLAGAKGQVADNWEYNLLLDLSALNTNNGGLLIHGYMDYTGFSHNRLRIGKFAPGLTFDGDTPVPKLMIVDRSRIGGIGFGRELGAALVGNTRYLDYTLGVYNGEDNLNPDRNNRVALGARVIAKPLAGLNEERWGKLQVGGSVYRGQMGAQSAAGGLSDRDRTSLGFHYAYKKLLVSGDYMRFDDDVNGNGEGFYTQAGYFLTPKWQLVGRYERHDPNVRNASDDITEYLVGMNYTINKNVRVGANYILQNEARRQMFNNLLRLWMQLSF